MTKEKTRILTLKICSVLIRTLLLHDTKRPQSFYIIILKFSDHLDILSVPDNYKALYVHLFLTISICNRYNNRHLTNEGTECISELLLYNKPLPITWWLKTTAIYYLSQVRVS